MVINFEKALNTTLQAFNDFIWGYIGIILILTIGVYLSFQSGWLQIRAFPKIVSIFKNCSKKNNHKDASIPGVEPIRAFYASLGGCIGIGNLATVAVAIQIGGPGSLLWIWVVALIGMIIKYSEIFLGIKYRLPNIHNGYDGGPMYFLGKAFPKFPWIASVMAFFLCIYGTEVYMFNVIKESVSLNFDINPYGVAATLLISVLFGAIGGVKRIGAINTILIPLFVLIFLAMTLWVLIENIHQLPNVFSAIISSAFSGHAPVGGFVGSTLMMTIVKGISSAAYSGDIGVGYASIIHSETKMKEPEKQAALSIFGIFLDTFIVCSCTALLLLFTGVWNTSLEGSMLVQTALSQYFPHMNYFMPIFFFILGYTTMVAYLVAGLKCAHFISPKWGKPIYYIYSLSAFIFFSFFNSECALLLMSLAGGMLMLINISAIFKLRKEIKFTLDT